VRERNWWLIVAACVLAALLVVSSVIGVEQRRMASKWMHDYHTEISDYHAEVHKNVALYASLFLAQQRLSSCVNDTNRVLFDIAAYFHEGFIPNTSESDATSASQTCQTTPQGN
jgi:hypothetical protein